MKTLLEKMANNDPTKCFIEFTQDILELQNTTKAELARRLDMTAQNLNKLFNGSRPVTIDMAIKIAGALNENVEAFVFWAIKEDVARAYKKNNIDFDKMPKAFKMGA